MAQLQDVPDKIKEFFGSERTTAVVDEISRKADIDFSSVVPRMLYRLETKVVSAHDFVEELSKEIGGTEKAGAIARAIKENVLEKIREPLFAWGVNISDINVVDAPHLDDLKTENVSPEKTISLEAIGEEKSETTETAVPIKKEIPSFATPLEKARSADEKTAEGKPLVLFKEKSVAEANLPAGRQGKRFRGFSFPGVFGKPKTSTTSTTKVRIEVPGEQFPAAKTKPNKTRKLFGKAQNKKDKRVVHYSELRTPLTPFREPEKNIIGLKPLEKTAPYSREATDEQGKVLEGKPLDAAKRGGLGITTPETAQPPPDTKPSSGSAIKELRTKKRNKYARGGILGEFTKTLKKAVQPFSVLNKIKNKQTRSEKPPSSAVAPLRRTGEPHPSAPNKSKTITPKELPAPQGPPAPKPPTVEKVPEKDKKENAKGPSIEGNIIDLR